MEKSNYGKLALWVIMLCQFRFNNYNKFPILVGPVDNGKGYACVGTGGMWAISVPSSLVFCEPKTAPKMF